MNETVYGSIKGVTCLECKSIMFSVQDLVWHIIRNPNHHYYSFSDIGVLYIDPFLSQGLARGMWMDECVDIAISEIEEKKQEVDGND